MADDYQEGAASWLAADEVGKVKYPRVKISFGPDGSAADVSTAAPLPVSLPTNAQFAGKQETLKLITANAAAPSQAAYGGDYVWTVTGTFGGASVQLQALAPDGTTWLNIGPAKTANDTSYVVLGSNAIVRAAVTGGTPTGLYATLSLIP